MTYSAFRLSIRELVTPYYKEPHRFHHTMEHIDFMLDGYKTLFGDIPLNAYIAIMYHDVIYFPWSKTNEEDSIALMHAHKAIFFKDLSDEVFAEAELIIKETKHHYSPFPIGINVVDLDLMIFGTDEIEYDLYSSNTRKEFSMFSDEKWKIGRAEFLKHMLERARIFKTPVVFDLYENQARKNIKRELESLS